MPMTLETRETIFTALSAALRKCCPPMVCVKDTSSVCEIIGNVPLPYGSRKKIVPGISFASAVARKDMVSFYFMPIYYHRDEFEKVAPGLLGCLKGKACFNFRKADQVNTKEVEALLRHGARAWKKLGYLR